MMSNQFTALFTQDADEMNQNGSKKQKRRTRAKKKKTNTRTTLSLATPVESTLSSHDNAWSQGAPSSVATPPPVRTHTSSSHGGPERRVNAPPKQKAPVSFTGGEFPSLSESTRGLPSKTGFQQQKLRSKPLNRSQHESSGRAPSNFALHASAPSQHHHHKISQHKTHYTNTSHGLDEPAVPNQPIGPRAGRHFVQQKHPVAKHHQQQTSVQAPRKYESNHIPGGQLVEDVKKSHHNVYNKKLTRSAPSPQVRAHKPHKAQQPQNNSTALPKMQTRQREEERQVQREQVQQTPQNQYQRPPSPQQMPQQRAHAVEPEKPLQHVEAESDVSESASDSISDYGQQQQQHHVSNGLETASQPDTNPPDNGFAQNQPHIPQQLLLLNMERIIQRVTILENQVKQLAEQNNHLRSELFQRAKLQNQLGQEHIKLYSEMVKFRSEMKVISANQKQNEKLGLSLDRDMVKQQGGFPLKPTQNNGGGLGGLQAPPGFQHPSAGLSSYQPMQQLGGNAVSSYFNDLNSSGSLVDNFDKFNVSPGLMHNMRDMEQGSEQVGNLARDQNEGLDHSQNRSNGGLMAYQPQTQHRQNLHHNPLHNSGTNLLSQSATNQGQQHVSRNQLNPLHNAHGLASSDQGGMSNNYQGYSSILEQRYSNNGQQDQRNEQVYENFRALLIGNDQMNNQL